MAESQFPAGMLRVAGVLGKTPEETKSFGDEWNANPVWVITHAASVLLADAGVIIGGHFELHGSIHSSEYLLFGPDFFKTELSVQVVKLLVEYIKATDNILDQIEIVIGPESGGAPMARIFADVVNANRKPDDQIRAITAHKTDDGFEFLREDRKYIRNKRALVADEVIGAGVTLGMQLLPLLKAERTTVLGIGSLAQRSDRRMHLHKREYILWRPEEQITNWPAMLCPQCKEGIAITKFSKNVN